MMISSAVWNCSVVCGSGVSRRGEAWLLGGWSAFISRGLSDTVGFSTQVPCLSRYFYLYSTQVATRPRRQEHHHDQA